MHFHSIKWPFFERKEIVKIELISVCNLHLWFNQPLYNSFSLNNFVLYAYIITLSLVRMFKFCLSDWTYFYGQWNVDSNNYSSAMIIIVISGTNFENSILSQIRLILVMRNLFLPYANYKGADQPAHPRSLISAFIVRCLDSIIPLVSIFEISRL